MDEKISFALAGNPNVGKSVVFQHLTGTYAEVSNYPGTTVDITRGYFKNFSVWDTPGIFGLNDLNEEEKVARQAITSCDAILNVIDATHPERDLFLTLQLLQLKKPLFLAVNMMDEVKKEGILIDLACLSDFLGVPVFPISAKRGEGIEPLKKAILHSLPNPATAVDTGGLEEDLLRSMTNKLTHLCVTRIPVKKTISSKLGAAFLHPLLGFFLLTLILSATYFLIGRFLSQTVIHFTQGYLMEEIYTPFILSLFSPILNPDTLLGTLLIGEFGLLTMVPSYLFGLLLPLITGFYFVMSLLEDSGLLPRIAVLFDRVFTGFGLNGKAVIPVLLGFGCVTMALITTRILGTERERTIASLLLCTAVPCSAQFSIIMVVASSLSPGYFTCYIAITLFLFFLVGYLADAVLPGISNDLFLVLPKLRLPQLKNLSQKTFLRAKQFLFDAGPLFLLAGVLISLLNYTNGFVVIHNLLLPLTENFLKLPGEAATLLFMCLIKRDLGAAYLFSLVSKGLLSQVQITVALTVTTLFVPCFASFAVLIKERGLLSAVCIWLLSLFLAFAAGTFIAHIL